ncbi:MAG: hypothetical protein A2X35_00320 [Elusimicrobia bacterium GWA2_61_42]|nr:MAG: hypothetical protein A2X35_00320 [Elusimicrobia bacterium GWA2_61_42]OGR74556.1 MAG: hypothetical protein A2X38_08070 [Elusimicrobia bacterium GWC2_61_25]
MAAQPLLAAETPPQAADQAAADPYLWLEEKDGQQQLDWVKALNKETLDELQADPLYKDLYEKALAAGNSPASIPSAHMQGDQVVNLWQDAQHVRGVWRRAPLAEYLKTDPAWDTLLDLDLLSKDEKENWVFRGGVCLPPKNRFCIVRLSRGGKDALVLRELDTVKKAFVADGFRLEESNSGIAWLDKNTLLLAEALGPESLTASGYPRVVRKWRRGTAPQTAPVLLEAKKEDIETGVRCHFRPEGKACIVNRKTSFYESEQFLLSGDKTQKLPLPPDAEVKGLFKGRLLVTLRSSWELPGRTFRQSSLVAVSLSKAGLPAAQADPELVFEPGPRVSIRYVSFTRNAVLLTLQDNVKGRVIKLTPAGRGWKTQEIPLPPNGTALVDSSDNFRDDFLLSYQSFLVPESIFYSADAGRAIKQGPRQFEAAGLESAQREAVSKDGTRIPYFILYPKGMKHDGKNPTLLTGYGGFKVPLGPLYSSAIGRLWLERGGVHVVANIRGGGEFGPEWHKAALQGKRQTAFDDFIAVAEDLVKTGVTSPARLGIKGTSNGGLLVGVMATQRPDLFRAVLCAAPLLDMLRYTKLPPGPQWVGEYGDPASPELGPVLAAYSPYQNIRAGVKYPEIFFFTSTKDDRVHPGHARKAAARLKEFGNKIYYYENTDGGHSGAANLTESARKSALEYVFLSRKLMD